MIINAGNITNGQEKPKMPFFRRKRAFIENLPLPCQAIIKAKKKKKTLFRY